MYSKKIATNCFKEAARYFIVAASLLVVSCSPQLAEDLSSDTPTDEFGTTSQGLNTGSIRVGVWYVPNSMTQAKMDDISAMGVDEITSDACRFFAGGDCRLHNLGLLDSGAAATVGGVSRPVKTWAWDDRARWPAPSGSYASNPMSSSDMTNVTNDYKVKTTLAGYHLIDEPGDDSAVFTNIDATYDGLAARDAAHPKRWVNLFGAFAHTSYAPGLGTSPTKAQVSSAYRAYINNLVTIAGPTTMTYDHYPFYSTSDAMNPFFESMVIFRERALAHNKPWGQFIQSTQHGPFRKTTREEELWTAMQSLAYGAKEIWWFTYAQNPDPNFASSWAIVREDGTRFLSSDGLRYHYDDAKAINDKIHRFGKYLGASTSTAVWHSGNLEGAQHTVDHAPIRPLQSPVFISSGAPMTVGEFTNGTEKLVFLANRSTKFTVTTDVYLTTSGTTAPKRLNLTTDVFDTMPYTATSLGKKVNISLGAGDAALINLGASVPSGYTGAEAYVGIVRGGNGYWYEVDSQMDNDEAIGKRPVTWNECPAGYSHVGTHMATNGFWVCARNDIKTRAFEVGNVVANNATLYRVVSGANAWGLGARNWGACEAGSTFVGRRFTSDGFWLCMHDHAPEVFAARVRANNASLYAIDSHGWDQLHGNPSWNQCPSGYSFKKNLFTSDGFWLCPRTDLLSRTYNVGNVVSNNATLYRLDSAVTSLGGATWNYCEAGRTYLGRYFDVNGIWVCY